MTHTSNGQFLPSSIDELKKRAKRVSNVLDIPLMKAQQGLAELYGVSSFHEASRRAGSIRIDEMYSDALQADAVDLAIVHGRDLDAIDMACRLTGAAEPGPRETRVVALGLFDSSTAHGVLYRALRLAIDSQEEMQAAVGLPRRPSIGQFIDEQRNFTVEANRLTLAIDTALSIDDEIAFLRMHGLALAAPELPWPAAAALIKAAQDGALMWLPHLGLDAAKQRAWGLRHLATWALDAYSKLQPTELADPDETEAYSYLRAESMLIAGQVFALIGHHSQAVSAYSLSLASPERTSSSLPIEPLRAISNLHLRRPMFLGHRDVWSKRGHRQAFDLALIAAADFHLRGFDTGRYGPLEQGDLYFARAIASSTHFLEVLDNTPTSAPGPVGPPLEYVQELVYRVQGARPKRGDIGGHWKHLAADARVRVAINRLLAAPDSGYAAAMKGLESAVEVASLTSPQRRAHIS